jgi:soluble lytic murein transglycosylase
LVEPEEFAKRHCILVPRGCGHYDEIMQKWLWLSVTMLVGVGACSTISTRQALSAYPVPLVRLDDYPRNPSADPIGMDAWLEGKYHEQPTDSMRLLVRYRQALLWSPVDVVKACTLWHEVTEAKHFPLHDVARVRAIETCPTQRLADAEVQSAFDSVTAPWLRDTLLRALLKRGSQAESANRALEMKLLAELGPAERLQRDRIRLLERAIKIAQEIGDEKVARESDERLRQIAPRLNPSPAPEQWMQVAADFRQAREFQSARDYYRRVLDRAETNDSEKLRALEGIRQSYKLEKNTERFIEATKEYASFARQRFFDKAKGLAGKPLLVRYLETQITLARAVWTEDGPKEAQAILLKAERELKGRVALDDSIFLRARIEEEAGRYKEAVKLLEGIDPAKVSERALRQKILWIRAWNLRRIGRAKDAITWLERLISEEDAPSLIARDRFWLGKTLQSQNETEKANEQFEWLVTNDPLGYYGLLAYRELKRLIPQLVTSDTSDRPTVVLPPLENLTAEWLITAGEDELARKFLDQASSNLRTGLDQEKALELLRLYARAGSYQSLFARMAELSPEARLKIVGEHSELFFPRPWVPVVKENSQRFDVHEALVYAIMRQESSFNPHARSGADAFGLMQLIPEAASRANRRVKLDYQVPEGLYEPSVNIPLGTAFLRDLLDVNKNNFILTVASYNASERAIRGWLKTRYRGDALEFIEDIPYEETRTYIKLVMRNFVFYSRLNAGPNGIEFPEWCLSGLQDVRM